MAMAGEVPALPLGCISGDTIADIPGEPIIVTICQTVI